MMPYHCETFNQFILDKGVLGFSQAPIPLSSGRTSHWYVNWRTVTEDVYLTEMLAETVVSFMAQRNIVTDTVYGVPEGATKLGLFAQHILARKQMNYSEGTHALAMGRGKPKEHGKPKDRYFLGMPKGRTVVLEDVTTTGNSLLRTIDQLLEADVLVVAALALTNRMELRDDGRSILEILQEKAIPYYALSNAPELLPLAYQRLQPGRDIGHAIEDESRRFGIIEINVIDPDRK